MTRTIYLDNAATTRVAPEVAEVVTACMTEEYGNPASAHYLGIAAERWVKRARAQLLAAVGNPEGRHGDIYFTSGGTEGDAIGVIGPARARASRRKRVVVSAVEHAAVRESAALLLADGFEVVPVPVAATGAVEVERFVEAVAPGTAVAALMLVQNEIGTLMPVGEVARAIRARDPDVHIHCDAVQALGKVPLDLSVLGVDSAAFAAHKFHGPKGVGALWLRRGARVSPLWAGGGQQGGLRSGTLNVPGIAALGLAAELAQSGLAERGTRFDEFAALLRTAADGCGVAVRENGAGAPRSPHVISLAFRGVPAEPLLHVLESRGVLCSAGSACAERDRKPSAVLSAIGLPPDYGTLRFSFGRDTSREEVEEAAAVLVQAVRSF